MLVCIYKSENMGRFLKLWIKSLYSGILKLELGWEFLGINVGLLCVL